jgi:hypothetical protein
MVMQVGAGFKPALGATKTGARVLATFWLLSIKANDISRAASI